jgi:hypothetical protein
MLKMFFSRRRLFSVLLGNGASVATASVAAATASPEAADQSEVLASGATRYRRLADKLADIKSLADFGARGDGVNDDTAAWNSFQAAEGIKLVPSGQYLVSGSTVQFDTPIIGNGVFDNRAGYWKQVQSDGKQDAFLVHGRQIASAAPDVTPDVKVQTKISYSSTDVAAAKSFTRVTGGYFETIGEGEYAMAEDTATGNFTTLAATAHNKFAGQFGMTAVSGRVWDAKEAEVPAIRSRGASKSCAGFFMASVQSSYASGGYMIGLETYVRNDADETEPVPYKNSDSFAFKKWTAGYHCLAWGNSAPISTGILIDGAKRAPHAYWNGIFIGGSSMKINNTPGTAGTVGLNFASWTENAYGDVCIKYRKANWHHYYREGARIRASLTKVVYEEGDCGLAIEAASLPYLKFRTGATAVADSNATEVGALYANSTAAVLRSQSGEVQLAAHGGAAVYRATSSGFLPATDGTFALGSPNSKWANIFTSTAPITTSDARAKTNVERLGDDVLDAWGKVDFVSFRLVDAVARKGAEARTHTGIIAQSVIDAFARSGLDVRRLGLICHDSWESTPDAENVERELVRPAVEAEDGSVTEPAVYSEIRTFIPGIPAGDRYGLRYEEALCLEAAFQRRRADQLEMRLAALEAKMSATEPKLSP